MVEGMPGYYASILHLAWDTSVGFDQQLAMLAAPQLHIQLRGQNKGTWSDWLTILDSSNFQDYTLAKNDTITNKKIDSICV